MSFFKQPQPTLLNCFIIEDNAMYNFFLKYHVHENYSFRVFDFTSFEACMNNDGETEPDLILLDYELPNINGLNTVPLLKKLWPKAQIVVISSKVDEAAASVLKKMQMEYCVAKKDCTVVELNRVIDHALLKLRASA